MNILCTKDFFMDEDCGGDRCFTAGETYEFKRSMGDWVAKDDQGDDHFMGEDDLTELTAK